MTQRASTYSNRRSSSARAERSRRMGSISARSMLTNGAPVAAVGERLGLSPPRFIELFRRRTGLTPKRYARIERFQHLIHTIDGAVGSWARLAIAHGYADQAHMIRDFKWFSGTIPTAYRAASREARNHVPLPAM